MSLLKKVLIANRGEIALRIIRAAQDLGIATVAVYSDADKEALHTQTADEAVHIGPSVATKSYLDVSAILSAAQEVGAEAIHPGYGFLAENAGFAQACQDAGLVFVGPSAKAISRMGDKALARKTAREAGVPTVPGSPDPVESLAEAVDIAERIGYPVMIKAAAGGGGRGIRVADDAASLEKHMPVAQQEAKSAFGDGSVYLERFIREARHVEVQVLGDGQRAVHLFERECSLQRRRQKIVEEALSPCITPELRSAMTTAAVNLTEAVHYAGAGTVEFLFEPEVNEFYFIEMNTRIQVEHPVTEMICGVDLVREQLHIASGEPLSLKQEEIQPRGWAIECRINAENPDMNFMPSPGTISNLVLPAGPWVRVDTAIFEGYTIPPFYDSLIAKLVVWGQSRDETIVRTRRCLRELHVEGIKTTKEFLLRLMENERFVQGDYHTNFLEGWLN